MSYSPTLGRWTSADPKGYVDGMDLYQYGMSSPINKLDPLGTQVWPQAPIPPVRPNPRPGERWATRDFVSHYYGHFQADLGLAPGQGIDLAQIGMLGDFQAAASVRKRTDAFEQRVRRAAMDLRFGLNCGDRNQFTLTFTDKKLTDVTAEIFALGKQWLDMDAVVTISATNCVCRDGKMYPSEYVYEGELKFRFEDSFEDPLDVGVEVGGTVYSISGVWTTRITGRGRLPLPS